MENKLFYISPFSFCLYLHNNRAKESTFSITQISYVFQIDYKTQYLHTRTFPVLKKAPSSSFPVSPSKR